MCDKKEYSIQKIEEFIPALGAINSDLEFKAHNFKTKGRMKIKNLNYEKISKLTADQIKVINSYFKKEVDLLNYFGYKIIE